MSFISNRKETVSVKRLVAQLSFKTRSLLNPKPSRENQMLLQNGRELRITSS